MPQPADFGSTTKIPRKNHSPRFMGRYFRVRKRLENDCIAFPFLFDYVNYMNMYFGSLLACIAARIHRWSSLPRGPADGYEPP